MNHTQEEEERPKMQQQQQQQQPRHLLSPKLLMLLQPPSIITVGKRQQQQKQQQQSQTLTGDATSIERQSSLCSSITGISTDNNDDLLSTIDNNRGPSQWDIGKLFFCGMLCNNGGIHHDEDDGGASFFGMLPSVASTADDTAN
jgi:hypothetical protein